MKQPKLIKLKPADVEALLDRVEKEALQEGDYEIIKGLIEAFVYLSQSVNAKATAIRRLLRIVFGAKTETREKLFKIAASPKNADAPQEESEPKQQPGHGRNGADAYKKAERIEVPIADLKAGESCRECPKGRLYPVKKAGTLVRFVGMAPLAAKIYELEKLRCNLCGEVFTAKPPDNVGSEKYDETAGAIIATLKYGSGIPFYRIEKLQESMGVPLPTSTQWDITENAANLVHPAYRELIHQAAQGNVIHNDDTPMKILELVKEVNEKSSRTGMFTTGMMSIVEDRKIALFFTGQKHAGENMTDLLKQRQVELDPPIQMCDALSRNVPKEFETILANCLVHGRRNFVDVAANFPEETAHVIDQIALVYRNDETAKQQNLSPQERLLFHQRESGPVMKNLKQWLSEQIEQKKTEPNSGLGKAIAYMLKHWDPLTLFLRVPGAPLDNNLCEQTLKKAILHRKNSLFYKTEHGAFIGDMFMSLIHTCNLRDVNPFDYLVAIQKHSSAVFKNPGAWMPWNYQASLPVNDS
ncbi:MAG: IS66 family transposase [Smithellaceae bacterium]|nr:IS66 family transposase [Smithellaceae bacterium]